MSWIYIKYMSKNSIIHVWLMPWRNRYKQHKSCKKALGKELLLVPWHPASYWDWFVPEDEVKVMEPIFTDSIAIKLVDNKVWWEEVLSLQFLEGMETFWDKKICMKTFSCVIFCAQTKFISWLKFVNTLRQKFDQFFL